MFFPAASQPGFWHFGNRQYSRQNPLQGPGHALLDMSRMSGNAHEWNAEETFRNDFRNLQGVNFCPLLLRQNTLPLPCAGFLAGRDPRPWLLFRRPGRKSFQFASLIFGSSPNPSKLLTAFQLGAYISLSTSRSVGKSVPSFIRMVPDLIVSGIWRLACVYSGTLFGTTWRRRLDVPVGLDLRNWPSHFFTATVVLRPGWEVISNSSIKRRTPGNPRPRLPDVEKPACKAWGISEIRARHRLL